MSFFAELKRRNVFRAATVYVAVAWLLIQVAETTFPAFGLDDAKLRILIVALVIGFIPAVALAWAFEITPEGVKRDRDLDPGGPLLARTNRLLDRGIVAVLALGLTYFAVDKFFLSPEREQARVEEALEQGRSAALEEQLGGKSIVVLPFTNLSSDPEQAFFADGMAEELLNLLARIPELRATSSRPFGSSCSARCRGAGESIRRPLRCSCRRGRCSIPARRITHASTGCCGGRSRLTRATRMSGPASPGSTGAVSSSMTQVTRSARSSRPTRRCAGTMPRSRRRCVSIRPPRRRGTDRTPPAVA